MGKLYYNNNKQKYDNYNNMSNTMYSYLHNGTESELSLVGSIKVSI